MGGNLINFFRLRRLSGLDEEGLVAKVKGKRWVVAGSRNEEDALAFLTNDRRYRLLAANVYRSKKPSNQINWFVLPKLYFLPKYLPFLLDTFQRSPSHFWRVFHLLIHGVGCLENQLVVLRQYRPEAIVISNDHYPFVRALSVAARQLGIPTVYLQHASVKDDFPPLICDLSLLDGPDALAKYQYENKRLESMVLLVGSPKYDGTCALVNKSTVIRRLGISYSLYDDPKLVDGLSRKLVERFPEWTITVRPHPRDMRAFPGTGNTSKIHFSNALEESALEFLSQQDAIISSDSAVHLEAVLLNVNSIFFPITMLRPSRMDSYGFVKSNLVPAIYSESELISLLLAWETSRPQVQYKGADYDAGILADDGISAKQRTFQAIDRLIRQDAQHLAYS